MSEHVEWVDPPPRPIRGSSSEIDWQGIADDLRQHPRQWGRLAHVFPTPQHAHTAAARILRGSIRAFLVDGGKVEDEWDARSHSVDGAGRLFVRYVGGGS